VVCCLWFDVWGLNKNRYVRKPGKTRGAIGFALIFLCFVSLYQDKEMKKKHESISVCKFGMLGIGLVICD
jgi:hypothetical protein